MDTVSGYGSYCPPLVSRCSTDRCHPAVHARISSPTSNVYLLEDLAFHRRKRPPNWLIHSEFDLSQTEPLVCVMGVVLSIL
jgi:hypothetical protein